MTGEIIKILPFKKSRNEGSYLRVEFRLENGQWAKTDLVPGFRNYWKWKRVKRVGNIVKGLRMKDETTVDADSNPQLIGGTVIGSGQKLTMKELAEQGVFG